MKLQRELARVDSVLRMLDVEHPYSHFGGAVKSGAPEEPILELSSAILWLPGDRSSFPPD